MLSLIQSFRLFSFTYRKSVQVESFRRVYIMLLCGNRHDDKTVTSDAASETIHGLKQELERCLVMYRGKREQLTEVNSALLEARNSVEDLKQRLERTEKELKETKVGVTAV